MRFEAIFFPLAFFMENSFSMFVHRVYNNNAFAIMIIKIHITNLEYIKYVWSMLVSEMSDNQ